jgi:hypothetical protein
MRRAGRRHPGRLSAHRHVVSAAARSLRVHKAMTTAVGVVAILLGILACFAGYRVFRIVLPILGFIIGLGVGAELAARFLGEPYLESLTSWVVAIIVGLVFATIAFLWWYVSVAITIAGLGYAMGYGAAVGVDAGADAATTIGIIVALIAAVVAIVLRIPTAIVIIMSAFWGASAIVGGALVLMGQIDTADLRNGSVDVVIGESTLLLVAWLALAVVGIVVQWTTRPDVAAEVSSPPP